MNVIELEELRVYVEENLLDKVPPEMKDRYYGLEWEKRDYCYAADMLRDQLDNDEDADVENEQLGRISIDALEYKYREAKSALGNYLQEIKSWYENNVAQDQENKESSSIDLDSLPKKMKKKYLHLQWCVYDLDYVIEMVSDNLDQDEWDSHDKDKRGRTALQEIGELYEKTKKEFYDYRKHVKLYLQERKES